MADAMDPKERAHSPPAVKGHPPPPPVEPLGPRPAEPWSGPLGRTLQSAIPLPPAVTAIYGLVRQTSQHSVRETARRLTALVQGRGFDILGDIDFAGDAGRAGLSTRPMRQIVFGNARTGTRLVAAAPTVALDLPLRVLIFEDAAGAVWLAYNDAKSSGAAPAPGRSRDQHRCSARARRTRRQRRAGRARTRFQGPLILVPGSKGGVDSACSAAGAGPHGLRSLACGRTANTPTGVGQLCGYGVWCGARCSRLQR